MTAPRHARTVVRKRFKALTSSLATLSLVAAGAVGLSMTGEPAYAAQEPQCPSDELMDWPGMGNLPKFTDNNVAVYVGGDAKFNNGESEGFIVVDGNLEIDRAPEGLYNLGYVGVGSQILPGADQPMLSVGGDLTLGASTSAIQIGRSPEPTGTYMVGGSIAGQEKIEVGVEVPYDVTDTHANGFGAKIAEAANYFASSTDTATYNVDGAEVTVSGDGEALLQIVTIPASVVNGMNHIKITDVPENASVVFNVEGDFVQFTNVLNYSWNGVDALWHGPESGFFASHTLWNLVDATDVKIGLQDSWDGQFLGSVLASNPNSVVESYESTNGRIYVAGDFSTNGDGREIHNYPFQGYSDFACDPTPFSDDETTTVTVTKHVQGDKPPADTAYTFQMGMEQSGQEFTLIDGETITFDSYPLEGIVSIIELAPDVDGFILENIEFTGVEGVADGNSFEFELTGEDIDLVMTNTFAEEPEEPEVPGVVPVEGSVNVEGDCAVPSMDEFSLTYQVEGEDPVTVPFNSDGSVDLPEFDEGTKVTFSTNAPEIDGLENGSVTINGSEDPVEVTIVSGENSLLEVEFGYDCVQDPVTSDVVVNTEVKINGECELPEDATFTITYQVDGQTHTETVDPNGSFTIEDLPVGTEITFEADAPEFDGLENGNIVINDGDNTITVGEDTTTINIVYEYDCEEPEEPEVPGLGSVNISTAVEVNGVCELPGNIEITVTYTVDGEEQTWTGSAGDSFTLDELDEDTAVVIESITTNVEEIVDGEAVITVDGQPVTGPVIVTADDVREIGIALTYDCVEDGTDQDGTDQDGTDEDGDDQDGADEDPGLDGDEDEKAPEDEADSGTGGDEATLPRTGSESLLLGLGAIVLLAAGGALILVTRRNKASQN